jgi:hypothetical protein
METGKGQISFLSPTFDNGINEMIGATLIELRPQTKGQRSDEIVRRFPFLIVPFRSLEDAHNFLINSLHNVQFLEKKVIN